MNVLRKYTRKATFDNMEFDMFVAGETRIILNIREPAEKQGRLNVLCKLSHWMCKCKDWQVVRGLFEAIIESVEMGESSWTDDFAHYETMLPSHTGGQPFAGVQEGT